MGRVKRIEKIVPVGVTLRQLHNFCIEQGIDCEIRKGKPYLILLEIEERGGERHGKDIVKRKKVL